MYVSSSFLFITEKYSSPHIQGFISDLSNWFSPTLLFFFKVVLALGGPLHFQVNFVLFFIFCYSAKNHYSCQQKYRYLSTDLFFCRAACESLVPRAGIKPGPPQWKLSLNHWTVRQPLQLNFRISFLISIKMSAEVSFNHIHGQLIFYKGTKAMQWRNDRFSNK